MRRRPARDTQGTGRSVYRCNSTAYGPRGIPSRSYVMYVRTHHEAILGVRGGIPVLRGLLQLQRLVGEDDLGCLI